MLVVCDFSPRSFKLKRGTLPPLTKQVLLLRTILSQETKQFVVNYIPQELILCKISYLCRCSFNSYSKNIEMIKKNKESFGNLLKHKEMFEYASSGIQID